MSNDYGRRLLEKHGWKNGCGLGKDESGIKEAIKVIIKNDTTGVGHDPGEQYTFQWWDHVFNKAANSITVTDTENGVLLGQADNVNHGVDIIEKLAKTYDSKSTLYDRFTKAGTLRTDGEATVLVRDGKCEVTDNDHADLSSATKLTEEEIFAKCGGRTAHRAARHGHKLNGKLRRVQEQEKRLLEKLQNMKERDLVAVVAPNVPSSSKDSYLSNPASNGLSELCNGNSVFVNNTDETTGNHGDCSLKQKRKQKKKLRKRKRQLDTSNDISQEIPCSITECGRASSDIVTSLNGKVVNETSGCIQKNYNPTDTLKVCESEADLEMKIRLNKSVIVDFLSKHSESYGTKPIYLDTMTDCVSKQSTSNTESDVHNDRCEKSVGYHNTVKKRKKSKSIRLSMDRSNEKQHQLLDRCDPGTDIVKKKRKKTKIACNL